MTIAATDMLVTQLELGSGSPRVAVKDSIDIKNFVTGMGSPVFSGRAVAEKNAGIIDHLLVAGARIVGKAKMHELAFGVTGINKHAGTPKNIRYPQLIPGGSSSGSATAVAADIADIGIGTDTGGSIRMPAACCGVVGLKPTFDRVSRTGVHPANSSLDCVGPFAKTVAGVERAMRMIDPSFVAAEDIAAPKLGVLEGDWALSVQSAFDKFITSLALPNVAMSLPGMAEAHQAGLTIIGFENWAAFQDLVNEPELGEDIRTRLLRTENISQSEINEARKIQSRFRAAVDQALEKVDALILPALPKPAPTLEQAQDAAAIVDHTSLLRPFNLSGHPAICLPMETADGLPFGIQLVGRVNQDQNLCAIARKVEEALAKPSLQETEV